MTETEIVWTYGKPTDWRFLRESGAPAVSIDAPQFGNHRHHLAPHGATTVGYTVGEDRTVQRVFWLLPPNAWVDGIEISPLEQVGKRPAWPYALVDPKSIAINKPSKPFAPHVAERYTERLLTRPHTLLDRWHVHTSRHAVRVPPTVKPPTRFKRAWNAFLNFVRAA
jgi:hypothetical protein